MIDLINIIYMNSKFHNTFTELVMKTLRALLQQIIYYVLVTCIYPYIVKSNVTVIYIYIWMNGWIDTVLLFTIGLVD